MNEQTSLPPVPEGFRLAGVPCGIKADPDKPDVGLIVSQRDVVAAGVYTQNLVHAANVDLNRRKTPGNHVRAVVFNSGNANTCTGARGWQDTEKMAAAAAETCGATADQVLVMSTGVIGEYLPLDRVIAGISAAAQRLNSDAEALLSAARAMLTTDKYHKVAARSLQLAGDAVQVTGLAKGAGMIGPNMATMLAVILTDATLPSADAQHILSEAVNLSFNCISVDGHTSTSDTVLLLASGTRAGRLATHEVSALAKAVQDVCVDLAKMIPADGEGASHCITIDVRGCNTREQAQRIAKTIGDSPLVKTGIAGADPNWGRIVSAAGYAGVKFNPQELSLSINGTCVYGQGTPLEFNAAQLSQSLRENRETFLELTFAEGDCNARCWASDLTPEYVRFNSEYTT